MKTKIKRHSRSVISVILAISMLISCMMVGIIATDAAKTQSESVGSQKNIHWNGTVYFRVPDTWDLSTYPAVRCVIRRSTSSTTSGYNVPVAMSVVGATTYSRLYKCTLDKNHSKWDQDEYLAFFACQSGYTNEGTYALTNTGIGHYTAGLDYGVTSGGKYLFYPNTDASNMTTTTGNTIAGYNNATESNVMNYNTGDQKAYAYTNTSLSSTGGTTSVNAYYANDTTPTNSTNSDTPTASYGSAVQGTKVTMTATANPGYVFDGWYADSSLSTKISNGTTNSGNKYTVSSNTLTYYAFKATNIYAKFVPDIITLTKPTISFNNSGAVNNGDGALLTVTNHSSYPAAANVSYELYKNSTKLTSGYSYNNGVFTIPSTTYSDGDSYQVKAIAGNTTDYANSSLSSAATLTVYEPKYALLGCADSADIENIINSQASHASTKAYGWPSTPVDDATHFNSTVVVDEATSTPGVYKITFTTKAPNWNINIGLYQKTVGQRGFSYNGTEYIDPTKGKELKVPSAGLSGVQIIDGTSSMQFKPNITYTITIDQRGATDVLSITSDAADIWAVARVKTFDPTTGQLNTSVANATAAVGTASASPSAGKTPFTSTLTAEVADSTKYEFAGWYTDANCTTPYNANATTTATVSTDITYYALFTQKTPDTVNLTIATTGSGTVTPTSGTHSGSGSSYTIYPGATVVFAATPGTDYELDTVTSTSGTVTKSGNTVTVSNITQAATVTFNFIEVVSYNVSVAADSATYGTFTVKYTNKQGQSIDIASTSTTQNIVVKHDTIVTVTATANTSGNKGVFNGWSMSTTNYQRSKETPLSANTLRFIPTGAVTATANFSKNPITGDQITSKYYIKVANNKTDTYSTNVPIYRTVVNGANEFRSYFEIGDTDDPANGKLKVGTNYWFIISDKSGDADISDSHYNASPNITKSPNDDSWYNQLKSEDQSQKYAVYVNFKSTAKRATVYWGKRVSNDSSTWNGWFDEEDSKYPVNFNVTKGSSGSGGGDDTPDVSGLTKLYVLDGIDMDGSVGTNSFGDSTIISVNSGVAKNNYYDATGENTAISSSTGHDEGGLIYYYDPTENLDFRVQTTIKSGHQALGVRAFVMNGMTYPAKKDNDGNYYADITLDADSNQGVLEVVPVYYNKLIEANGDYIKFYVDANTIGDKFGKTIGYSVWYKNKDLHGETGGYPGQPLMSDGTLLYGYFPEYYVSNDATAVPPANERSAFAGVLLSNLAEHNDTHKDVLTAWGASTANYQSFDYEDPVEISKIADVDMIEFVAKYKTLSTTHRWDSNLYSRSLNGTTNKSWPSSVSRPSSASDALTKGFEYLTDIDGKRVNIFNDNTKTLTGTPLYVVSAGNQQITPNDWDTVWVVYTASGNSIAAARPVDFINPSSSLQTTLASYTNSPVLINYEGWLAGENNSGTRLDGRWLYSRSTDDTTLRLRVATKDNSGNLTFMTDGISWAEISNGTINGPLETADASNLTKILNLDDRTTEVTAKINPVGYTVEGMYMLGAAYSGEDNNGYSTKISDYDDMNVTGTATSFVNAKDNRMVIVVKQIPATDLVITHQMYGGPGAHKIKGFYYVKAELFNSSGTSVKTYNSGNYTNKPLTLTSFTTDAPKNGGYKLKVTIKTVMSGSASFYQWYENDHNNGYDEINSETARGSVDPVEKEIEINVDSLYGESALNIQNLDYYSDLQSADNININHLLLPSTISADLDGDTYTQVTVLTNTGTTVSGGAYAAKMKTTEVSADFITTDNADNGYQLKVEIWTIPKDPAGFDKFYKNTTDEMVTEVDEGMSITTGLTKTFNGQTYESAQIIIPISFFFKDVWDEDTSAFVKQFDSTKKNFNTYSGLKVAYKYSLHFDFQGYRNLYGNLGYDVAETEFTAKELEDYFVLANDVIDTNNNTVTAYKFKNDDARNAFINLKAPYENTFMETVKWQTDMYGKDHPEGMTATYSSSNHKWSFVVKLKKTDDRFAFVKLRFPYAVKNYDPDKHAPQTSTITIDDQSVEAVAKLTNNDYVEFGGRSESDTQYRTGYGSNYFISGSYLTAADKVWNTTDQQWEYFDYWKVENVGDSKTGSAEYTRCYYPEFNLSLYQDSIITPVYSTAAQGTSPSQRAARDDNARTDTYSTKGRATITLMENSRMQWTGGRSGNTLTGNYVNGGDRIYTDFLVSYTYQDLQLNTDTTGMKAGVVIETVRDLDKENDEYVTKPQDEYKINDDSSINKSAVEAYIKNGTGTSFLKTEFSVTTLDNKNRKNQYYSLPNISQTSHNPTVRKNKLYRAYSYLKDKDGNVLLISDPIYFTIYDIASIENMSAGAEYGGVS